MLANAQGVGTIVNDDTAITIDDFSRPEGNGTVPRTFSVFLSAPIAAPVTVNYATADGTATEADGDYQPRSGTLTFDPGETMRTINVVVNGDFTVEPDETFSLNLSGATNAVIEDAQGVGTIVNDDTASIIVNDVSLSEENSGISFLTFSAVLSAPSFQTITVNYATADGTATVAGGDYQPTSGTLTFDPGETVRTINVQVNGDFTVEPDETFTVNLSAPTNAVLADAQGVGTIANDDGGADPCAGRALVLDGSGWAETPHTAALNALPITVTAWIKTTTMDGVPRGIVNKYLASSLNGYQIYLLNGKVYAWYFGSPAAYVWDGSLGLDGGLVNDGAWHHVAFTVDAAGGRLYVDGVEKDTQPWTGTPAATSSGEPLRIGAYPGDGNFIGQIDEVTIWSAARSQSEILAGKNKSLAGSEPGLLAYYRFDEAAGPAGDWAAGRLHPATLQGTAALVSSDAPIVCIMVTNLNDAGLGSLRQALADAAALPGRDRIVFATGLSGDTITVASQITIDDAGGVEIDATTLPGGVTVSGGGINRIFWVVDSFSSVSLRGLSLTGGNANNGPTNTFGGAINVNGRFYMPTVALDRCTLSGNTATDGGAILNGGTLTLTRCTIANNSVSSEGGGIYHGGGALTLTQCTIAGNAAGVAGGGVFNNSPLTLTDSIIVQNSAGNTIPDINIPTSTIRTGVNLIGNLGGSDASIVPGPTLLVGDARLAPLANYGGPTMTMPPMPGSPALDTAGPSSFTTDQRGLPRPQDNDGDSIAIADIGAVEGVHNPYGPGVLAGMTYLSPGKFRFQFTEFNGSGPFRVFASPEMTQRFNTWTELGFAVESPVGSGEFIFTDPNAASFPRRFYHVVTP